MVFDRDRDGSAPGPPFGGGPERRYDPADAEKAGGAAGPSGGIPAGGGSLKEEATVDTSIAMTRLEAAVEQQVLMSGGDSEMEAMATALLGTLEPVVHQLALDLAEQAAAEVAAQLASHEIEVVLQEGEPSLRVRSTEDDTEVAGESLDARITLRLPPTLKQRVEVAADEVGESVNSWLVRTLASQAAERGRRSSRRVTGTIET